MSLEDVAHIETRRKKARCPGERPVCSFCDRLKQNCDYDDVSTRPEHTRAVSGQARAVGFVHDVCHDANARTVEARRPCCATGVETKRPYERKP